MKDYHRRRREGAEDVPNRYETHFVDRHNNVKEVLVNIDMIPGTKKSVASISDISEQKNRKKAKSGRKNLARISSCGK